MCKIREGEKYIVVTMIIEETEDAFEAECIEIGTASFGDTLDEARKNIIEATLCHIEALHDIGELHHFLKERKIRVKTYHTPKTAPRRRHFEVNARPDAWASQSLVPVPA